MRYNYPGLIDFELRKVEEKAIFFGIHYQDPSLTAVLDEDGDASGGVDFTSSTGYIVQSYDYIDVMSDVTYLLGYQKKESTDGTFTFLSRSKRDKTYDNLLLTLIEFAASRDVKLLGSFPEPEQLSLWD